MNPKQHLSSRQIIALLAQIEPASKGYPYKLMAARRSAFLQQAAGLSLGTHGLSVKAFRMIRSAAHPAAQITAQWGLGIMATALAVTAVILARNVYLERITPEEGGTVPSETAILPSESSPTEVLTTFTPTAVTPTATPTATDLSLTRTAYSYATLTYTPSQTATPAAYTTAPVEATKTDDTPPTVTKTPRLTNTPHPTNTPRPTYTPRPTDTPRPTKPSKP